MPNNKFWAAFCEALDEPALAADPELATNAGRIARRAELIPRLAARFRTGTRDHWIERFLARGIPAGPVHTLDEVVKDGYLDEAGMLTRMTHPDGRHRGGAAHFPSASPRPRRHPPGAADAGPALARLLGADGAPAAQTQIAARPNLEPVDGRPSMKTLRLTPLLVLALAALVPALGLAQQDKPITLRLGHILNETSLYHVSAARFADALAKNSGGRLKVDIFPTGGSASSAT